jgi:CheY-like chemotaxis protein
VVTDLRGRVEVDSKLGQGSTFRVILPPASRSEALPSVDSAGRAEAARRGSILVVDDEPLILKIVAAMLGEEHDVICEARADAALARIRDGARFDAIVCDLMMPQVSGMDLHAALLEFAPGQARAMLFLTGGAFTARARAFLERVPNATIDKPFDAEALASGVRRIVG